MSVVSFTLLLIQVKITSAFDLIFHTSVLEQRFFSLREGYNMAFNVFNCTLHEAKASYHKSLRYNCSYIVIIMLIIIIIRIIIIIIILMAL